MRKLFILALLLAPLASVAQEDVMAPPRPPTPEIGVVIAQAPKRVAAPKGDNVFFIRAPGMGTWWKNSDVVKQLQASDAQVQQIERIYQENRMRLIDLKANLEKEEVRLEPLVQADNPDEGQISAQIDKVAGARAELEKTNALMQVAIRRVLTLDQWKKLQSLEPLTGPGRYRITVPLTPGAPLPPPAPGAPRL